MKTGKPYPKGPRWECLACELSYPPNYGPVNCAVCGGPLTRVLLIIDVNEPRP
jgi:hypothetical protein